jgi:hypothetical protein
MSHEFTVDAGLVVFSYDGRAQFGWLDRETSAFYGKADGRCIADAVGAIAFRSDVMR